MDKKITLKWLVEHVEQDAYNDYIPLLVNTIKVASQGCFQAFSIYDFHKNEAIYYSETWKTYFDDIPDAPEAIFNILLGNLSSEGNKLDFETIDIATKRFLMQQNVSERIHFMFISHLNIVLNNKNVHLIRKSIPLLMTKKGDLWIVLNIVFPSTMKQRDDYYFENTISHERYALNKRTLKWELQPALTLNPREKDVLLQSIQGYSITSISQNLFVTVDCIKSCRRKLFEKLGVRNIQEAITYAMNMGML